MRVPSKNTGLMLLIILILNVSLFASVTAAPPDVQAAFIIKLLSFERNLSFSSQGITIYVLGAQDVADALEAGIGKPIGKATLAKIERVSTLPTTTSGASVIYVGDPSMVEEVKIYCRNNKVLSITGNPEIITKGISMAIAAEEGKPTIFINLSSSKAEGVNWNPAILKVASTID